MADKPVHAVCLLQDYSQITEQIPYGILWNG